MENNIPVSPVITKETPEDGGLTINNLHLRLLPVDRQIKSIKELICAIQEAERTYSPNRSALYDLYDSTVGMDLYLQGIVNKRRSTLLNKKLTFVKSKKEDENIAELVGKLKFREMRAELFNKKLYGVTGIEFIPGAELDFKEIPRKHIRPDTKMITQDQWGSTGIVYEDVWNLWVLGKERGCGLYLVCAAYVIWKKGNMGDWAQFIEIFGQPIIKIIYDGFNEKVRIELDELAKNIASSSRIVLPKEANMEVLDGKQSNANGDLQNNFRKAINEELAVFILGNTQTTSGDGVGSLAKAKEHGKQQDEITKDDMIEELGLLNDPFFFAILKSYGFSPEGGKFVYEDEVDLQQLTDETAIDTFLVTTVKLPLDDDYFYEKYKRPKPANYKELKKKQEEQQQQPPAPAPGDPKPPKDKKKIKPKDQSVEFEETADDPDIVKKVKRAARNYLQQLRDFFAQAPR
jgi:hypothetical protein